MKFKSAFIVVCAFLLSLGVLGTSFASQFATPDQDSGNLTLASGKSVADNYITAGNIVDINGDVNGDLIAAGNQINVTSNIIGNVFLAGSTVRIEGTINKDAFIGAGNIIISKDAVINGDLITASATLTINGTVNGSIKTSGSTITINGKVSKNISAYTSSLVINSDANILGNVSYTSDKDAKIDPAAKVLGQVTKKTAPQASQNIGLRKLGVVAFLGSATAAIISLITILIVGIVLLLLFPKKIEEISENIKNRFWPSFGLGFLSLIITPVIIVLLFAIILGIPLALILMALYIFALYTTKIFVGLALGKKITNGKWSAIWAMTLGVVLLSILEIIPILNIFVGITIVLSGLGAITLALKAKK